MFNTLNIKLKHLRIFNSLGYLIVSDPYFYYLKKKLRYEIFKLANFFFEKNKIKKKFINLDEAIKFMNIFDKQKNTKLVSEFYDLIPSFPFFYNLASDKMILKIIKKIGLKVPTIGTIPAYRIDRPFDEKFNTLIHQDFWYSFISKNSITIWFLINEKKINNIGNLKIATQFNKKVFKFNEGNFQTHNIDKKFRNKINFREIKLKKNEILIFNQLLLHMSGKNTSEYPRMSVQIRYNDIANAKLLKPSFKPALTNYVKYMQKKYYRK